MLSIISSGEHAGVFLSLLESFSGDVNGMVRLIELIEKSITSSGNGLKKTPSCASATKDPDFTKSVKSFYFQTNSVYNRKISNDEGSAIQLRSSGDSEKDTTGKLDQTKSILYFTGVNINCNTIEVSEI